MNVWYADFYDLLQTSAPDPGSGEPLVALQTEVWRQLVAFAWIAVPNVLMHPLFRLVQAHWVLLWRMALVRSYLARWKRVGEDGAIEGAAQRVHEDARLFTAGVGGIVMLVVDAVATMCVFAPVLFELGAQVAPPGHGGQEWPQSWLVSWVVTGTLLSTCVTVLVGSRLIRIEVAVQRVEATLRTLLVWLESSPELIVAHMRSDARGAEASANQRESLMAPFVVTLGALWKALARLYLSLWGVNTWLALFNEGATLFPYLLGAPLLFAPDPAQRITLGTLVKMSNAFGRMVGAIGVVSENYAELNAFAAVVVRLREFERAQRGDAPLLVGEATASVVELAPRQEPAGEAQEHRA